MDTNDNETSTSRPASQTPDAHGHAALLLVESLIHGLLARAVLTVGDAIEIVDSADHVQVEVAEAADGHGAPMWRSHALLSAIAESLRVDMGDVSPPLRPVP